MFVDLHGHGTVGAIIAYCLPKGAKILAKWKLPCNRIGNAVYKSVH